MDAFGEAALRELSAIGVDLRFVKRCEEAPTPLSTILSVSHKGSRTIVTRRLPLPPLSLERGALGSFHPHAVLADGHEGPAALGLFFPSPTETLKGAPPLLDCPMVLDAGSPREGVLTLLPVASHVVASERCAAALIGRGRLDSVKDSEEALYDLASRASRAMDLGPEGLVGITLGARGVTFLDPHALPHRRPLWLPALRVQAIDTTGAGDIFHGALLYALAERRALAAKRDGTREDFAALYSLIGLACAAAALSTQSRGALPSIPSLEEASVAARRLPARPLPLKDLDT